METQSVEFKDIEFEYEVSKESTKNKTKSNKKKDKGIQLDDIKLQKSKKKKGPSLSSIGVCKTKKAGRKKVEPLAVATPKVRENTIIGLIANKTKSDVGNLKSKSIITTEETIVYREILNSLPKTIVVFPKVRLSSIVLSDEPLEELDNIVIDFLICDKSTTNPICAIQLYNNDNSDAKMSNEIIHILRKCNIEFKQYHIATTQLLSTDIRELEKIVFKYQAPICVNCMVIMEVKESKQNKNFGHRFYGCVNFPDCKENIDID